MIIYDRTISELSEELSRKKELYRLRDRIEKLQAEAQENEKRNTK